MRIVLGLCAAILAGSYSLAAEIKLVRNPDPKQVPAIIVRGLFVRGDAAEFERQVNGINRGLVVLSSPGGSIDEAFRIGAAVNIQGLATMVVDECASACGLVWLSGKRRYFSKGARIGFHAAYVIRDGKPIETGMGNAEIGSFLTHLGLSREAIRFIASAPPEGMRWLTPEDARRLKIAFLEGAPVTDPSGRVQRPSYEENPVKTDVARDEMYGIAIVAGAHVIALTCKPFYRIDEALIQKRHKALMDEGQKFGDKFVDALGEILVRNRSDLRQDGHKAVCDQNKAMFTNAGVQGVYLN
ncbi:hypothetical protein LJR009_002257 [Bosea sp. LjRoot9]|uniref:hypothetical protein n=1 Tax=Bosea sp. LjRoot9 TaxID=3342341 RepID=UPI003ECC7858